MLITKRFRTKIHDAYSVSVTVTNRERQLLDPETPHKPRYACKYIPFTMYVSNE